MTIAAAIAAVSPGKSLTDLGGPDDIYNSLRSQGLTVRRVGLGILLRKGWCDKSPNPYAYGILSAVPYPVLRCYLDSAAVAAVSRLMLVIGEDDDRDELSSLLSDRGWSYCPRQSLRARSAYGGESGAIGFAVYHKATATTRRR